MKTVKRLPSETVLEYNQVNIGRVKAYGKTTGKGITFAVIDEAGNVVKAANGQYEIYQRKETAEKVADWYNR